MKKILVFSFIVLLVACSSKPKEVKRNFLICENTYNYNYEANIEEKDAIDNTFFDDAAFFGDSRMGTLVLTDIGYKLDVTYVSSLMLSKIDVTVLENDSSSTMLESMHNSEKDIFYLMFGLNELGYRNYEYFRNDLDKLVKDLLSVHPYLQIYLIGLYTPLEAYHLDKDTIYNKVNELNEIIRSVAVDNKIYYLNPNDYLLGDDGFIKEEYVVDGVHLNKSGTLRFYDYLKRHYVRRSDYVEKVCY